MKGAAATLPRLSHQNSTHYPRKPEFQNIIWHYGHSIRVYQQLKVHTLQLFFVLHRYRRSEIVAYAISTHTTYDKNGVSLIEHRLHSHQQTRV
jgi:hypothetical protein